MPPRLDNQSYYDTFAGWYERERSHGYHAFIDDLQVGLIESACRGHDVLEVGCGTGALLKRTDKVARRAVGIDLSGGMLAQARERGLCVMQATAERLPFKSATFDVVYSFKVLAHVEAIEEALAEVARVLRPGGRAFLEFYNRRSLRYLAKRAAGPGKIAANEDESAVFTRWDRPSDCVSYLPSTLRCVGVHGVRIFTPAASAHKLPVVSSVLQRAEQWGCSRWPFKGFGGFYVLEVVRA